MFIVIVLLCCYVIEYHVYRSISSVWAYSVGEREGWCLTLLCLDLYDIVRFILYPSGMQEVASCRLSVTGRLIDLLI